MRRVEGSRRKIIDGLAAMKSSRKLFASCSWRSGCASALFARASAAGRERRLDEISVVLIVLEVENLQGAHARRWLEGGVSLTTAQNPPSSFTASMNS